jgi:hypothetical protein
MRALVVIVCVSLGVPLAARGAPVTGMLNRMACQKPPTLGLPDEPNAEPPPPKPKKKKRAPEAEPEEAPAPRRKTSLPPPDEPPPAETRGRKRTSLPAEDEPAPRTRRTSLPPPEEESPGPTPQRTPETGGGTMREIPSRRGEPEPQERSGRSNENEDDALRNDRPTRKRSEPTTEEDDQHDDINTERRESLRRANRSALPPLIGIVAEIDGGIGLAQSSSSGVASRFGFSLKTTWETGRLLTKFEDDWVYSGLALQFSWTYAAAVSSGTKEVNVTTALHYFSLAAVVGWPIGSMLIYAELGPSLQFEQVSYNVNGAQDNFGAATFGLLYGAGARYRHEINDGHQLLYFRFAADVYRRGYMNDATISLGAGLGF